MAKKSAYVVWIGRVPGVYRSWSETEKQVNGFPGADFKGFTHASDAEAAWNNGNKLKGGGHPYVHASGIPCGHGHKSKTRKPEHVTCPACRRILANGGTITDQPKNPKAKPEKVPIVFRLWNLKTAAWASENRHERSDDCLRERISRVKAADPRVEELARAALLMVREDDTEYRERRQRAFDERYPKTAARRVAQHEHHGNL